MTAVSEEQHARIDSLMLAYLAYQKSVNEAKARAELRVLRETLAERLAIARDARALWKEGVPARTLGAGVMGTANYNAYMLLLEDGARVDELPDSGDEPMPEFQFPPSATPFAAFTQEGDKTKFRVTLQSWGPTEISGAANFIFVEGEWLNAEVGNEVGEYVERALFVDGSDAALRGLFDSRVS